MIIYRILSGSQHTNMLATLATFSRFLLFLILLINYFDVRYILFLDIVRL